MADTAISAPGARADLHPPSAVERPDFEVVPRKGLLIVAIPVVLLIIAIAVDKLWPLMFLHVSARAWAARARQHRRPDRAEEAAAPARGDRAADEALHLLRRHPRRDAGRDSRDHDQAGVVVSERRLPPVTELGMASLALIVAGGIYLSAHLPQHVPLAPAVILLVLSVLLLAGNMVALSRVEDFPWKRFFQVAKWSLL